MYPTTSHFEPILLLQTKLYRPQASPTLIHRPRLVERLNQGLACKLTLVVAPAGYGKTTIVTQWLHHTQALPPLAANDHTTRQVAWLSLDESDNDLILFLHYLVAAIRQAQPNSCANTLATLHNPQPLSWSQLVTLLINDLVELTEPLVLVLDDYHFIIEPTIHHFLDRLLDYLPPSLHLVLIGRTEPPLSLPRLRVRQQMNELRTADLSFTLTETEHYLTQATNITPQTIAALQDKSEGWITGLYLAKLALSCNKNEQALLSQFQASNIHIIEYLMSEVLAQQPPAVQTFLLYTSILRRFCPPLCVTLLAEAAPEQSTNNDQITVQNSIDWLRRQDLFLITLDNTDSWYRYHHLFQLMLTRRLHQQASPDTINALHHKASRWFAQEGFIDEALHHALIIHDHAFAAHLVEQNRINLLNQFDYHTISRWLSLLPDKVISQHPQLILLNCWLALSTYRLTAVSVPQQLQQAQTLLQNISDKAQQTTLTAEMMAIQGTMLFWNYDFPKIINYYHQAINNLPPTHLFIRVHITLAAAISLQSQRKTSEAIHIIQTELQNDTTPSTLPSIWLRGYLAIIYFMAGRPHQVIQTAKDTIQLLEHHPTRKAYAAAIAHRWLGTVYYQWNQLATARHHFQQADPSNSSPYYNSQLFLAWSYEMTGQPEKADQIMNQLHHWALPLNSDTIHNSLTSFQARRLCWQEKVEMALAMMREVKVIPYVDNFLMEIPALTHAKILIAHNQTASRQEAQTLLNHLWTSAAEKGQNIPGQIEILALKALFLQQQGQTNTALATLEQAIQRAKPMGFIRTFVDLGSPMASLLYQLLERNIEPDYLSQILAAFAQTDPDTATACPIQEATQTQLIEPLTQRELDVLCLLAEEMPNKKIAQQLSISTLTVKRHTINIYKKLSVSNRRSAVSMARTLGILLTP